MRIVELPKVTGFSCARGSNLARLYGQIRLTKAAFGDKLAVCEVLVDVAEMKAVYETLTYAWASLPAQAGGSSARAMSS